jgi:hypothetical protein
MWEHEQGEPWDFLGSDRKWEWAMDQEQRRSILETNLEEGKVTLGKNFHSVSLK